ncbi:MAG: SH3 domain-containing protein [Rhodospirillaceae bacterium]|nr:SH3 domain-containing protein [Rhodospirillaceae bacterium]
MQRKSYLTPAVVAVGLALAAPMAARAEAPQPCGFDAYVIDLDPKGTNIRSGPSGQSRVVASVKGKNDIQVSVVATQNGWFRIKQFSDFSTGKDTKIDGWMHGSVLGSGLMIMQGAKARERLREEPSDQSKTLLELEWDPGEDGKLQRLSALLPGGKTEVIDNGKIKDAATAIPLACNKDWIKIKVHKYAGWVPVGRLCGNPVTTCN